MGNVRGGVPITLARLLRDQLSLGAAVETGTFRGDSTALLGDLFPIVWSIELSPELHRAASTRLKDRPHITILQGSSREHLSVVCDQLTAPALFWLDGHWSGAGTAGELDECPVLAELASIDASAQGSGAAILIDDARLFFGPPPPPHRREQWPTFLEVAKQLNAVHDRYVTALDDVIIAVPAAAREIIDKYWLAAQAGLTSNGSPWWKRRR
ncbi:MAG TPA: hypothetical protein VK662_08080 [Acidothermaceae bacterium]|jgi:hypothetical protein|nr:hypothetical protein [Acidothermaceae bacterium]